MKITKAKLKEIILQEVQLALDMGPSGFNVGDKVMIRLDDPADSKYKVVVSGGIDSNKLKWVRIKSEGEWDYAGINTLRIFRRYRDENFHGETAEPRTSRNIGEIIEIDGDMVQIGFRDQDGKPVVIMYLHADLLEPA